MPAPSTSVARIPTLPLLLPLVLGLMASGLIVVFDLDRAVATWFYEPGAREATHRDDWWGVEVGWVRWLYDYGNKIGLVIGIAGLLVAVVASARMRWRPWWRPGLFLALALLLGPGLVVNGLLKPETGRPRPMQIETFGGERTFAPLGDWRRDEAAKSFPSGHASMGFFLLAPYFLLRKRWGRLAVTVLVGGVAYGVLMGIGRMATGSHWLSDIIWSGLVVWYVALGVALIVRPETAFAPRQASG